MLKQGVLTMALSAAAFCAAEPFAVYQGNITNPAYKWERQQSEAGKMVYVPFEGTYESKGGRIQSPKIKLEKPAGKPTWCNLSFRAKTASQCYWWVDLFDAKGNPLPDINSAVYPSENAAEEYNEMIPVDGRAAFIQFAFQSEDGVEVSDFEAELVSSEDVANWCDDTLADLPDFKFDAPATLSGALPKTAEAFAEGRPWRIVMLGDSIQNDTYTSCFGALVEREFPDAKPEFLISVRGSTGCWYYHDPAKFREYVTDLKPDLLLIGGISNIDKNGVDACMGYLGEVIEMGKKLGCEIAVLSPPKSADWRPADVSGKVDWSEDSVVYWSGVKGLIWRPYEKVAEKHGVPFFNMTVPTTDYLAASGKPHDWFNRDMVHSNDRGKQILGRTLAEYLKISCSAD